MLFCKRTKIKRGKHEMVLSLKYLIAFRHPTTLHKLNITHIRQTSYTALNPIQIPQYIHYIIIIIYRYKCLHNIQKCLFICFLYTKDVFNTYNVTYTKIGFMTLISSSFL